MTFKPAVISDMCFAWKTTLVSAYCVGLHFNEGTLLFEILLSETSKHIHSSSKARYTVCPSNMSRYSSLSHCTARNLKRAVLNCPDNRAEVKSFGLFWSNAVIAMFDSVDPRSYLSISLTDGLWYVSHIKCTSLANWQMIFNITPATPPNVLGRFDKVINNWNIYLCWMIADNHAFELLHESWQPTCVLWGDPPTWANAIGTGVNGWLNTLARSISIEVARKSIVCQRDLWSPVALWSLCLLLSS